MSDLIDRWVAIDAAKDYWKAEIDAIPKDADFSTVTSTCDVIMKHSEGIYRVLDHLPTAQPKTGTWIHCGWAIACSECNYDMPWAVRNYCPNCGARMKDEGR